MKKKKGNKVFWVILICLFVAYMGLYIANESGYYESKMGNRVKLTNESIKKFERDVANGKNVTIEDYLEKDNKDYSNKASKLGLAVSKETEKFMSEGIFKMIEVLGKLFS